MFRAFLGIIILFFLAPDTLKAQLKISYPYQRMVIQRDLNNQGTLEVAGNISSKCDRIEIKLESHNGFPATPKNWITLDSKPQNGIFKGEITAQGGWYKITVRAIYQNKVIATDILEPVGVGEVFLISGQSNAEGNIAFSGATKGSNESRVITVDYTDIFLNEGDLPYRFTPLIDNKKIGPYQNVPWIWAVMAENIVNTYQVPVLLFGAAVGGMGSDLWYGSSRGVDYSIVFGRQVKFSGSPYGVIARTLKNYLSFTGLRAILWQQGESDRLTTEQDYFRNISHIINQSRFDLQANIPWIIAESSRTPDVYFQVINAQRRLVQQVPNCYSGPNTDQLFGSFYRADGVHFHNQGIVRAGELWFEAIRDQDLLGQISSVSPKKIASVGIQCNGTNSLTIELDNSQLAASWSNNTFGKNVRIGEGAISAIVKDNIGIRYPFPEIIIDKTFLRKPKATVNGSLEICDGESLEIKNNENVTVQWSTGESATSIQANKANNYFFDYTNAYGCKIQSDNVLLTVNPKPQAVIVASQEAACEGDSIQLATSQDFEDFFWNTGENTPSISVRTMDALALSVIDQNGCSSDTEYFNPVFFPKPAAPQIRQSGVFGLEANVALDDSIKVDWFINDTLLQANTNYIKANKNGVYTAQTLQSFQTENLLTCSSNPSTSIIIDDIASGPRVKAYPIPNTGILTVETLENYDFLTLTIFDIQGRKVFNQELNNTSKPIDINLSLLSDGNYILEAKTKLDIVRSRLILRKSN